MSWRRRRSSGVNIAVVNQANFAKSANFQIGVLNVNSIEQTNYADINQR